MKVITVDIKGKYRFFGVLFKACAVILLFSVLFLILTNTLINSEAYYERVSEISENTTVIIDAGHGGEDCGTIGVNGTYEKDLNLIMAKTIGDQLTSNGFAVIYTRTSDKLLYNENENIYGIRKISDLKNRCKIGAEYPNSIFVSIHMNSYKDAKYSGLQVYYSTKDNGSFDLANSIQASTKKLVQKENNRKTKRGENIYLLENLDNVAVLIECGFLSNEEECAKLCEKEYQKELSFAIVCGIIDFKDRQ